jgi:hypothetical protein
LQGKEGVKGQYWFMEADMKNASTLRPDKTGKALLTVLRHLGRIQEACPWQRTPQDELMVPFVVQSRHHGPVVVLYILVHSTL